jgi:hypothetical protein
MKSRRRKFVSLLAVITALSLFGQVGLTQDRLAVTSTKIESAQEDDKPSVIDVSFDDIKFEMKVGSEFKEEMLTDKIRGYDGKMLRIRGFIRPSFSQSGLKKFVFVRDNQECCFGPGAALYDCIMVQLAEGVETEYTLRPITVKGTFFFKQYKGPDGEIWAIYRMKDAVVE